VQRQLQKLPKKTAETAKEFCNLCAFAHSPLSNLQINILQSPAITRFTIYLFAGIMAILFLMSIFTFTSKTAMYKFSD